MASVVPHAPLPSIATPAIAPPPSPCRIQLRYPIIALCFIRASGLGVESREGRSRWRKRTGYSSWVGASLASRSPPLFGGRVSPPRSSSAAPHGRWLGQASRSTLTAGAHCPRPAPAPPPRRPPPASPPGGSFARPGRRRRSPPPPP